MNAVERTALRYVLATIWLVTAALSFGLYPMADSIALVQGIGASPEVSRLIVYAGALLDLAMGALTLWYARRWLWLFQIAVISVYTLLATVLVPEYWLHPFGPLLKNLAVLALLWLLYRHDGRGGRGA